MAVQMEIESYIYLKYDCDIPQLTKGRDRELCASGCAGLVIGRLQVRISAEATLHQGLLSLPSIQGR